MASSRPTVIIGKSKFKIAGSSGVHCEFGEDSESSNLPQANLLVDDYQSDSDV